MCKEEQWAQVGQARERPQFGAGERPGAQRGGRAPPREMEQATWPEQRTRVDEDCERKLLDRRLSCEEDPESQGPAVEDWTHS